MGCAIILAKPFKISVLLLGILLCQAASALGDQSDTSEHHVIGPDAVYELHQTLQAYVTSAQVANISFGVWQHGLLVTEGFYGPVSQTQPETVSDTSLYRIRSMTKPITAIGLLILMERGHFELDDPITNFLPEFEHTETLGDYDAEGTLYTYRAPHPPTMAQLLSHTAGFGYWLETGGPINQRLFEAGINVSVNTDELVEQAARVPYAAMPGAEWHYSMASDLQGAIIERISGQRLGTFLQQELFVPLGMRDTQFYVPGHKSDRLTGVAHKDRSGLAYVRVEDPRQAAENKIYHEGGHGLYSTQRDYFRFLEFLRNDGRSAIGPLLSQDTLALFRTNAIKFRQQPARQRGRGSGAGLGFGFGVATIEDPIVAKLRAPQGTYFWYGALGTWFWVDPQNEITFIGMIQSPTPIEPNLLRASMRAVYGPGIDTDLPPPPS